MRKGSKASITQVSDKTSSDLTQLGVVLTGKLEELWANISAAYDKKAEKDEQINDPKVIEGAITGSLSNVADGILVKFELDPINQLFDNYFGVAAANNQGNVLTQISMSIAMLAAGFWGDTGIKDYTTLQSKFSTKAQLQATVDAAAKALKAAKTVPAPARDASIKDTAEVATQSGIGPALKSLIKSLKDKQGLGGVTPKKLKQAEEKLNAMLPVIETLKSVGQILHEFSKIGDYDKAVNNLKTFSKKARFIGDQLFTGVQGLTESLEQFDVKTSNKSIAGAIECLRLIRLLTKELNKLAGWSALLVITTPIAMIGTVLISGYLWVFKKLVLLQLLEYDPEVLKGAGAAMTGLSDLIFKISISMLLAALAGNIIQNNVGAIVIWGVTVVGLIVMLKTINMMIDGLAGMIPGLKMFKSGSEKKDGSSDAFGSVSALGPLILTLSVALIAAAFAGKFIESHITGIAVFTGALLALVGGLQLVSHIGAEELDIDNVKSLSIMVAVCSGVILLAAFTGDYVLSHIVQVLVVCGILLLLITGLMLATKLGEDVHMGGIAMLMIVTMGIILLSCVIGDLVIQNWLLILAVAVAMFIIVGAISLPLRSIEADWKQLLIIMLGLIAITALMFFVIKEFALLKFGEIVAALAGVIIIGVFVWVMAEIIKDLGEVPRDLLINGVVTCVAIGLIAALLEWVMEGFGNIFVNILNAGGSAMGFLVLIGTVVVSVWLMGEIIKNLGKIADESPEMIVKGVLVVAAIAGIMWGLGKAYQGIAVAYAAILKAGGMGKFLVFMTIIEGSVYIMGQIIRCVGNIPLSEIVKSGLVVGGIALVLWILGKAFTAIAVAYAIVNKSGGMLKFLGFIGLMGLAVVAFGALMLAIGAGLCVPPVAGFIAIGGAAVAAIGLILLELGHAFQQLAIAKMITDAAGITDAKQMKSLIDMYMAGITAMKDGLLKFGVIQAMKCGAVATAIFPVVALIGRIGMTVAQMATLKIPEGFDKDGKATGYCRMTPSDFMMARYNVGLIIKTLFKAVFGKNGAVADPFVAMCMTNVFWSTGIPKNMLEASGKIGEILGVYADQLQKIGNMVFPDEIDPKTGKAKTYKKFDAAFPAIKQNMHDILTTPMHALIDAFLTEDGKVNKPLKNVIEYVSDEDNKTNLIKVFDYIVTCANQMNRVPFINNIKVTTVQRAAYGIRDFTKIIHDVDLKYGDSLPRYYNIISECLKDYALFDSKNIQAISKLNQIPTDIKTEPFLNLARALVAFNDIIYNNLYTRDSATSKIAGFVSGGLTKGSNKFAAVRDAIKDYPLLGLNMTNKIGGVTSFTNAINKLAISVMMLTNQEEGLDKTLASIAKIITTLNNLDEDRVDSLTRMMHAISGLANKLHSIDKATNTMLRNLERTLRDLYWRIQDAQGVINGADDLQKKRQEEIRKSVLTIQKLMSTPFNVSVTAEAQEMPATTDPNAMTSPAPDGAPGATPGGTPGGEAYKSNNGGSNAKSNKKDKSSKDKSVSTSTQSKK